VPLLSFLLIVRRYFGSGGFRLPDSSRYELSRLRGLDACVPSSGRAPALRKFSILKASTQDVIVCHYIDVFLQAKNNQHLEVVAHGYRIGTCFDFGKRLTTDACSSGDCLSGKAAS
jgi:hypothetical protein